MNPRKWQRNFLQSALRHFAVNGNACLHEWCWFVWQVPHYRRIPLLSHKHITRSHMHSHKNGKACDETTRFTLCKLSLFTYAHPGDSALWFTSSFHLRQCVFQFNMLLSLSTVTQYTSPVVHFLWHAVRKWSKCRLPRKRTKQSVKPWRNIWRRTSQC